MAVGKMPSRSRADANRADEARGCERPPEHSCSTRIRKQPVLKQLRVSPRVWPLSITPRTPVSCSAQSWDAGGTRCPRPQVRLWWGPWGCPTAQVGACHSLAPETAHTLCASQAALPMVWGASHSWAMCLDRAHCAVLRHTAPGQLPLPSSPPSRCTGASPKWPWAEGSQCVC